MGIVGGSTKHKSLVLATARVDYVGTSWQTVINTTIKSANTPIGKLLAPTWDMVMGFKKGKISWEEYTEEYYELLRERYIANQKPFVDLLDNRSVVFTCYCNKPSECHRYLLVDIVTKIAKRHNKAVRYIGDLK